jgi:hypothetical protein
VGFQHGSCFRCGFSFKSLMSLCLTEVPDSIGTIPLESWIQQDRV